MSKLEQLIAELCPDDVKYLCLNDIGTIFKGMSGVFNKWADNGNCQFIDYKNVYKHIKVDVSDLPFATVKKSENQFVLNTGDILFTSASETPDECAISSVIEDNLVNGIFLDDHLFGIRIKKEIGNPTYFNYYFRSINFRKSVNKTVRGVTRFYISMPDFARITVPVPPIEVQNEIVRILDNFTELTTELTTRLAEEQTARKKQYEYYKSQLFKFDDMRVEMKPLGDEFSFIRNGFVGTATPYYTSKDKGVRYLKGTNIHNGVISDNEEEYITPEFHQKHIKNQLKPDDILVVQSGHVGECAVVGEKYAGANCHALIIMSNDGNCNSKYVVYYLQTVEGKQKLARITTGGTIKHILASGMKKLTIPFPTIEVQNQIVAILDRFDALCNDISTGLPAEIEARQKQYEYYRDKLLTF